MARSLTTRKLIEAVRSLIDEDNEAEIDDVLDLLPSLNRGLDDATDILVRKYPDALIKPLDVELSEGEGGLFPIPEDAYQERLEKVETNVNGYYSEIKRIDYRDITLYDTPQSTASPYYYAVIGPEYKLVPPPSGISKLRIWYIPEPGPLVPEYGRITHINTNGDHYVRLTDIEDVAQISTDKTSLEAFVNLIDGRSGRIKATLQVSKIVNSQVFFKATPDRVSVQGRTLSNGIPATAEIDDYICPVDGTCIPPMRSPLTNFLIAYCSAEIKALKLDGSPSVVLDMLNKFEERIERTWVRREHSLRIGKSSRIWSPRGRAVWSRNGGN